MYNHNSDDNINNDGSTIVYPEFIPMSNQIGPVGSTNSYLNNMRREMLSIVNNNNINNNNNNNGDGNNNSSDSGNNTNNDSIIININADDNRINISKSGFSTISNATSNENLNKTLLENNEISSINDMDRDDDEYKRYSNFISSLSYITFIGAAIVLINQKKSVYIQFHAYQSFYISMGVIGFQFLLIWSNVLSIILWSLYLLFTIFMFFKISFGRYSTIYKLPVIGNISEQKAKLRSQEYAQYFKYHEDLFIKESREFLIRQSNLNNNSNNPTNRDIGINQNGNGNNNGHQRINSNTSSVVMSSDVESTLNSSGSNSSIYSDIQNDIGTNEE
ncbi:hypothetical protein RB653_003983 [Dictyostelium firmibasis]|uniref:Transmembrane protein n=1 Tax=Dictyostelium firmibasis TaxID=79012 RepID=A0AAN7U6T8_9MYCE